jgi:hypothetical protein
VAFWSSNVAVRRPWASELKLYMIFACLKMYHCFESGVNYGNGDTGESLQVRSDVKLAVEGFVGVGAIAVKIAYRFWVANLAMNK